MSKSKNPLIAMVATAVMVGNQRVVIQPGQELPEIPEHDEKELVESGAALDVAAKAATDKAKQQEVQFAQQEFQRAREAAMAREASTAKPEAPLAATTDSGAGDDAAALKADTSNPAPDASADVQNPVSDAEAANSVAAATAKAATSKAAAAPKAKAGK